MSRERFRLTGFFIEPLGDALREITEGKKGLTEAFGSTRYSDHPPHLTILTGYYPVQEEWLGSAAQSLSGLRGLEIRVTGPHVFFDDVQAGGGHTLALKVEREDPLVRLQIEVAERISKDRKKVRSDLFSKGVLGESFERYGFPFVGTHWIPHFTLACLPVVRSHPRIEGFLKRPFSAKFFVDKITVWEISESRHERISEIPLTR